MSQLISALKSNGVHPTGVETEKKVEYSMTHSKTPSVGVLLLYTYVQYIRTYISTRIHSVLGCVCIWCAWVCLSSVLG